MTTDRPAAAIAALEEALGAMTPGPWGWRGNMDWTDPRLVGAGPCGGTAVLSSVPVERTPDDPRIRDIEDFLTSEQAELARAQFLFDPDTELPRTDLQMALCVDGILHSAREFAVYEVCRSATSRNDPRVYRADIVDVNHPDAKGIVLLRNAAPALLKIAGRCHRAYNLADELAELATAVLGAEEASQ